MLQAQHGADDWCTVRAADDLSALLILPLTAQQTLQAVEQGAVQLLLQCVRHGKEHMAQYTPIMAQYTPIMAQYTPIMAQYTPIMVLLRFLCAALEPVRPEGHQQWIQQA